MEVEEMGGDGAFTEQTHKPYLGLPTTHKTYVHVAIGHVHAGDAASVSAEHCQGQGLDEVPHNALCVPRASDQTVLTAPQAPHTTLHRHKVAMQPPALTAQPTLLCVAATDCRRCCR